jgi:hypothetical protein
MGCLQLCYTFVDAGTQARGVVYIQTITHLLTEGKNDVANPAQMLLVRSYTITLALVH